MPIANAPKTQYLKLGLCDSGVLRSEVGSDGPGLVSELESIEDMSVKITSVWDGLPHLGPGTRSGTALVS